MQKKSFLFFFQPTSFPAWLSGKKNGFTVSPILWRKGFMIHEITWMNITCFFYKDDCPTFSSLVLIYQPAQWFEKWLNIIEEGVTLPVLQSDGRFWVTRLSHHRPVCKQLMMRLQNSIDYISLYAHDALLALPFLLQFGNLFLFTGHIISILKGEKSKLPDFLKSSGA